MPEHRLVVLDDWTRCYPRVPALNRLLARGEVVPDHVPAANEDEVIERLRGATVVAGAGAPGGHAAVAELGLALLLALVRQIAANNGRMRTADWEAPPTAMPTIAWSPTVTPERASESQVEFERSDVLFASARLTDASRGCVGAAQLTAMRLTSYLVNIARGPIVDEAAMAQALQEGRLAGAGLDVYSQEPLPADHPLLKLDNVVLTPHIGWGIESNFLKMVETTVESVISYLDSDLSGVVNVAVLERRAAGCTKD